MKNNHTIHIRSKTKQRMREQNRFSLLDYLLSDSCHLIRFSVSQLAKVLALSTSQDKYPKNLDLDHFRAHAGVIGSREWTDLYDALGGNDNLEK